MEVAAWPVGVERQDEIEEAVSVTTVFMRQGPTKFLVAEAGLARALGREPREVPRLIRGRPK